MSHFSKIFKFRSYLYIYLIISLPHFSFLLFFSPFITTKSFLAKSKTYAKAVEMTKTSPSRLVSRNQKRTLLVWWQRRNFLATSSSMTEYLKSLIWCAVLCSLRATFCEHVSHSHSYFSKFSYSF